MKYQYFKSPTRMDRVERYITIESESDNVGGQELILPDGTPGLLFVESGSFCRLSGKTREIIQPGRVYLFGQKTKSVLYRSGSEDLKAFGAKLNPDAIYKLFGISAGQLTDQLIDLESVSGTAVRELEADIRSTEFLSGKIKLLSSHLAKLNCLERKNQDLTDSILENMRIHNGCLSVKSIADQYAVSYKFLERLFNRFVGVPPKLFSRILRFNAGIKAFAEKPESKNLTDMAYSLGYFDQMHFIKEFKAFTGQVPSRFYEDLTGILEKTQVAYLQERD